MVATESCVSAERLALISLCDVFKKETRLKQKKAQNMPLYM
jgi:hypothetical protein